jgi:hypothetical protein
MPRSFNYGAPPRFNNYVLRDFKGVDFSSYPSEVHPERSPDALNIISPSSGMLQKRTGYKLDDTVPNVDVGEERLTEDFTILSMYRNNYTYKWYRWSSPAEMIAVEVFGTIDINIVQRGNFFYYKRGGVWTPIHYAGTSGGDPISNYPQAIREAHYVRVKSDNVGEVTEVNRLYCFGGGSDFVLEISHGLGNTPKASDDYTAPLPNITAKPLWLVAKIPTTVINRLNTGGGVVYEDINRLTPLRENSFYGDASALTYQLDATVLDTNVAYPAWYLPTGAVTAYKLNVDGTWTTINEGAGLTVNRTTGVVTFSVAVGVSPVTGMDNLRIQFCKGRSLLTAEILRRFYRWIDDPLEPDPAFGEYYEDSVSCPSSIFRNASTYGLYGLSGNANHLFVSIKNWDYRINTDTMYAPETGYTIFGTDESDVTGYSATNDYQVIYKKANGDEPTLYLRRANLDSNNEIIFPITRGVPSVGCSYPSTLAELKDEPMFLSPQGVYGLVSTNVLSIQSVQNRSYMVDMRLLKEPSIAIGPKAIAFEGNYYLFIKTSTGTNIYIADSRKKSYQKNAPTESYQYEWYLWTIDQTITSLWVYGDTLYFGSGGGKIFKFKKTSDANAYTDDNGVTPVAVSCYWITPVLFMGNITALKSLKNVWTRIAPFDVTSIEIYYLVKGQNKLTKDVDLDPFGYAVDNFERLTFNWATSPHVVVTNRTERKFMSIQLKYANTNAEAFGLIESIIKYRFNSDFKGG